MISLLTALVLTAAPLEAPAPFQPTLLDDAMLAGAGGDAGAGAKTAFVVIGTLATGTSVALPLIFAKVPESSAATLALLLVPAAAAAALHVGLGALLGVDVTWSSAFVGAALGTASGLATGFGLLLALPPPSGGLDGLGHVVLIAMAAWAVYAIATPLFTLWDPFELARPTPRPPNAPPPAASEPDISIETRPIGASNVESGRKLLALPLWSGRF